MRSLEHLLFEKAEPKSEIKSHLTSCDTCKTSTLDNFDIVVKCKNDHETKINEAVSIMKFNPQLNKNLFNKGSFYTLKVYS